MRQKQLNNASPSTRAYYALPSDIRRLAERNVTPTMSRMELLLKFGTLLQNGYRRRARSPRLALGDALDHPDQVEQARATMEAMRGDDRSMSAQTQQHRRLGP
ncbi:hypothetical protein GOC21_17770 [Sinorhizobium meliloti]|nr:hypothetical protein [Sinorhizobium meliloti]